MRIIAFVFAVSVFVIACGNNDRSAKDSAEFAALRDTDDSTKFTTIQWLDSIKDFGSVTEGQKVEIMFRYKNTGDKPLAIQSVAASCGCTVPEYTQELVAPGKEGYVKAVFNSAHQPPTVLKTITVSTNTRGNRVHNLQFMGEVKPKN